MLLCILYVVLMTLLADCMSPVIAFGEQILCGFHHVFTPEFHHFESFSLHELLLLFEYARLDSINPQGPLSNHTKGTPRGRPPLDPLWYRKVCWNV